MCIHNMYIYTYICLGFRCRLGFRVPYVHSLSLFVEPAAAPLAKPASATFEPSFVFTECLEKTLDIDMSRHVAIYPCLEI